MTYLSFSKGFKPGGSNLTYGFTDDNAPPMVFQTFEPETVDSVELGLKTDLFEGKGRAVQYLVDQNISQANNDQTHAKQ